MELSKIYKKRQSDRDIFQNLMQFKVQEILLIATHYDAYTIEEEGAFFERIFGEYLQLNLYTAPRIKSVHSEAEALKSLQERKCQIIIIMAGLDKKTPVAMSENLKKQAPDIPIVMLVNNNSDLAYFKAEGIESKFIDRVFVWNGDLKVFLAITKYVEDKTNVAYDTQLGNVRVILLVEDSVRYYTRYLPMLYSIVMQQTQDIIAEKDIDEEQKILQMRARPKILLCTNFDEAKEVVDRYHENLLTVISDVKFMKDGVVTKDAGVQLLKYVTTKTDIPCLLQSSNVSNQKFAGKHDFVHKHSETLGSQITNFMMERLGFGDFLFKNAQGKVIAKAANIREFKKLIASIPDDSFKYHAGRNSFSTWLMARGQINLAKSLRPYNFDDFSSLDELRAMVLSSFDKQNLQRLRGRVITFSPKLKLNSSYITRLGKGSLGGKGRGLSFVCNFIENIEFKTILPDINITIPKTCILGTDEYHQFMKENDLYQCSGQPYEDKEIKLRFVEAQLNRQTESRLRKLLKKLTKPLAVRSSGLFEDSLLQPFSGVYATYLIPNNHEDIDVRLEQLTYAIKLVYASVYSRSSRNYFDAVNYKVEEERMAITIQELVGSPGQDDTFYTHISGVADSYNYYPFSYMKPEDGFAILALGLGMYNAGGEPSYRFCPAYPKVENKDLKDQIKDSQSYFYALDMQQQDLSCLLEDEEGNIAKRPVKEAEKDGIMHLCAQVYDFHNDRLGFDFSKGGQRVLNFANILKYETIPLAESLKVLLNYFSQAMGTPVQMEFALNVKPQGVNSLPSLYILQIKPMIQRNSEELVNLDHIDADKVIFSGEQGMGNGIIEDICDVVVMNTEAFDRTLTQEMAEEVAEINRMLEQEGRNYVLIGPGRWGTRDRFTGIPVSWAQIANARVIIEMGLPDFPLEASLGSHFFHNVTSMNIGYFSVPHGCSYSQLHIDKLTQHSALPGSYKYFKIIRFQKPLSILMDGRQRKAVIYSNEQES